MAARTRCKEEDSVKGMEIVRTQDAGVDCKIGKTEIGGRSVVGENSNSMFLIPEERMNEWNWGFLVQWPCNPTLTEELLFGLRPVVKDEMEDDYQGEMEWDDDLWKLSDSYEVPK